MAASASSFGGHLLTASHRVGDAIRSIRGSPKRGDYHQSQRNQVKEVGEEEARMPNRVVDINEEPLNTKAKMVLTWMRKNLLLTLTLAGVIGSVIIGLALRQLEPSPTAVKLVSFPGELLVRMLKILILPLTVTSLVSGMAKLDLRTTGRMGIHTIIYYIVTTTIAVIIGVIVAVTIHPGDPTKKEFKGSSDDEPPKITTLDAILDILRNMFPDNIVQASFQQVQTVFEEVPTSNASEVTWKSTLVKMDGPNILGVIMFSIVFGILVGQLDKKREMVVDFFYILNEIIMKLVKIVMWYSPFGILCLIVGKIMSLPDLAATASQLGLYMTAVVIGLLIHAIVILPGIYFLMTRKNPFTFFLGMLQAWLTALATASSAASLPVTFHCLEVNNGVDERVTRFITSIGASVNKDGTALYEAVAAIFIAQMNNVPLGVGSLIIVSLTAILASIGAAAIPSTALVTMILILSALGLPSDDISLLFAVDWMLDRFRTSINVLGNSYGAGIIYHLVKKELQELDALLENKALKNYPEIVTVRNNEGSLKKTHKDVETNI